MTKDARLKFTFEKLTPERFPLAKNFFKQARYHSHVGKDDEVYILRDITNANKLVAAVRLVTSSEHLILRSMVVDNAYRNKGVGSLFLQHLQSPLSQRICWCFPFTGLEAFYAQVGFRCIPPDQTPSAIADKFHRYTAQGRKLSLMIYSQA
jgi:N-acetylglutamate synthase-like GNAT family acetyltransferase